MTIIETIKQATESYTTLYQSDLADTNAKLQAGLKTPIEAKNDYDFFFRQYCSDLHLEMNPINEDLDEQAELLDFVEEYHRLLKEALDLAKEYYEIASGLE